MNRFAGYPSAFVHQEPSRKAKKINHLLWGDFVRVLDERQGEWVKVRTRGAPEGWMHDNDLQAERILEVNFVDIGQGDGCFIVTPDDQKLLLDAGEGDNMSRFLRWRFNLRREGADPVKFQYAIITHSDSDHYLGFRELVKDELFEFETILHNGLVERKGADLLGPIEKVNGVRYQTEVITNRGQLKQIIDDDDLVGKKLYPNLLRAADRNGRSSDIRMLCAEDGCLPGYEADKKLVIRVLAPVPEHAANGDRLLRSFGDDDKTKNGHSIILKVEYGNVRILLGGDLNIPAEEYLLNHYTDLDPSPGSEAERTALVEAARQVFEADVFKACHHGSGDFTSVFLEAVNPLATVISSGDDEPHAHPRPEAIGALGKFGRGERPLIFSTELARSAREAIKHPNEFRQDVRILIDLRNEALENGDDAKAAQLKAKLDKLLDTIERTVTVYGLINLRTDGQRAVLGYRLEQAATRGEWDLYPLEPDEHGRLHYVSKHAD